METITTLDKLPLNEYGENREYRMYRKYKKEGYWI